MTPKEKAEELVYRMHKCLFSDGSYDATQCAIVAVSEILELDVQWLRQSTVKDYPRTFTEDQTKEYWIDVFWNLKGM